jgi:hypothetical protein
MLTGILPDTFEMIAQQENGELTEGDWLRVYDGRHVLPAQVVWKLKEDMAGAICSMHFEGDTQGLNFVRTVPACVYGA